MGAALTYARRYALFALVGIAGEDDLDAPDLNAKIDLEASKGAKAVAAASRAPSSSADRAPTVRAASSRKEPSLRPSRTNLGPEQSAALCEQQLIVDLALLESEGEAADWVHKNLPAKNTLTVADAALVETSFRDKLAAIQPASAVGESQSADAEGLSDEPIAHTAPTSSGEPFLMATEASTPTPIVLPGKPRPRRVAAKTIRLRDKEHCKFVTRQPCVVCGRTPSEAHHIRFAQPRALGRKVSDEYTVPVCRLHHRELHRYGDEASWWAAVSIDPLPIALSLWHTHQDESG